MTSDTSPTLALTQFPCPVCASRGTPGRIGNRRSKCRACNAFARRVERATLRELARRHEPEVSRIRGELEADIYHTYLTTLEES